MDRWNQRVVKREQCSHTNMGDGFVQIQENSMHTNIKESVIQIQDSSAHTNMRGSFVQIQHSYKYKRTVRRNVKE